MAAATVALDRANKAASYAKFKQVRRGLNDNSSDPTGLFLPLDSGSFTPPSTSTDDVGDVYEFMAVPLNFKLYDLQIVSTADVDTGGVALVFDLTAFDGTTHTVLISGCTVGSTGSGKDEMDRNLGNMLLDIGGQFLTMKITTPATSNAGTGAMRCKVLGYQGALPNVSA